MIKKIKYLVFFLIFLIFFNCSFDNKTGIWNGGKEEKESVFSKYSTTKKSIESNQKNDKNKLSPGSKLQDSFDKFQPSIQENQNTQKKQYILESRQNIQKVKTPPCFQGQPPSVILSSLEIISSLVPSRKNSNKMPTYLQNGHPKKWSKKLESPNCAPQVQRSNSRHLKDGCCHKYSQHRQKYHHHYQQQQVIIN